MGRSPKFTQETKMEIIQRYLNGERLCQLRQTYGFATSSLRSWLKKYRKKGMAGLEPPRINQSYTKEFKEQVVQDYITGKGSELDLADKYGISSRSAVSNWIKQYNSHEEFKSNHGGRVRMTKSRKTTLEERIQIVEYCIEHNSDYGKAAEQFEVSYAQVYSWLKRYNEQGVPGLKDNRGRGKPLEDMNELERLKAENKLLGAKNKQLQMETDVLKKVKEIERGRS